MTTTTSPPPNLLTIPLELRQMVYHYLSTGYSSLPGGTSTLPLSPTDLLRHTLHPNWGHNSPHYHMVQHNLCSLRATSRQLWDETRPYLSFPSFQLTFYGSISNNRPNELIPHFTAILTALRNSFIAQNLVHVVLYISCVLDGSRCYHRTGVRSKVWPLPRSLLLMSVRQMVTNSSNSDADRWARIDGPPYRAMLVALHDCPKLEMLYLDLGHGNAADWFRDPTSDFALLVPLLRRGVRVFVNVLIDFDRRRRYRDVYGGLVHMLEEGSGDVVLEIRKRRNRIGYDAAEFHLRTWQNKQSKSKD